MKHAPHLVAFAFALILSGASADDLDTADGLWFPDPLPLWRVDAAISARTDYFDSFGDAAQSPYPETGLQSHLDAELGLFRRISAFEHVEIGASGLLNDSEYRLADEKGLILERFHASWEKGDAGIPFRMRGGDFFAEASPRTIGRALRGGRIEIQPAPSDLGLDPDAKASLVVFAGRPSGVWRDVLDPPDDVLFAGASGLYSAPGGTSVALNAVYNDREAAGADLDGAVFSLAAEHPVSIGAQRLTLEGEAALYHGDHDGGGAIVRDATDTGVLLAVSGYDATRPLSYSARYERYGGDFRPQGASVGSDREALELRSAWRFEEGLLLSGRAMRFIDGLDSGDRLKTLTVGGALAGPVPLASLKGATMNLDAFATTAENQTLTTDSRTLGARFDLNFPLSGGRLARLSLDAQDFDDAVGADSRSFGARLGVDMPVGLAGWRGAAAPFVYIRDRQGVSALTEAGAGLGLVIAKGASSLDLSASTGWRDGAADALAYDVAARYSLRRDRHTFGAELELHGRSADPGADGGGFRAGLFYSMNFHKAAKTEAPGEFLYDRTLEEGALPPVDGLILASLSPGLSSKGAEAVLSGSGLSQPVMVGSNAIYETVVFPRLPERQRLIVREQAGEVVLSAVVIDRNPAASPFGIERSLAILRRAIGRSFGPPDRVEEEGRVGADILADLDAGRFIRLYEWSTSSGVVRLGAPRRTDRTLRIEIQYARDLPPPQQPFWSLEEVR